MKIVKALKTTLYSPLSASGTSIVLKKFVDMDGTELAMSDFGDWGVIVIKQGDTVEIIKFSGLSQSSSDTTCTLTVATNGRSIAPTSPYAGAASGNAFNAGAEVIVSNDPLTLSRFANLDIAQTFTAIMTFSAMPQITAGNPVLANDIARKAYVDSVVAGIATTVNVVVPATAGETVAAGNLVYFDDTDNEWKLCDADTATTVENVMLGIAQGAGVDGGAIAGGVLVRGLDANQSGLTAGTIYYVSNTAGGISASVGTKEVTIGFAYSATQLYFNPRFNQQLTEDQQDALAGTEGTPSSTVPYATKTTTDKKVSQSGAEIYAADAGANDTYVITLSPVPSAYTNGMVVRFKANTANTGAATLNVNSLGAKSIVKNYDVALADNDIKAGQIVSVIYDGTNFQLISPISNTGTIVGSGQTSRLVASGTGLQTIAHGLGVTPKLVVIQTLSTATGGDLCDTTCVGSGNASASSCSYISHRATTYVQGQAAKILRAYDLDGNIVAEATISALDATNITLNFTTMAGTGIACYIQWQAFA